MNIFERAHYNLSLSNFNDNDIVGSEISFNPTELDESQIPDNQYVLRMMVCHPNYGLQIPEELNWLKNTILQTIEFQKRFVKHAFIYVTVRCGLVKSVTDDQWHVDGFSMRIPHTPEQNYIYTDFSPTEILRQHIQIPVGFDPFKHNLHSWFQKNANNENAVTAESKKILVIDPYIIHRRPPQTSGVVRKMFRISHVPIEIKDDANTRNPLMPEIKYGNVDFRHSLVDFNN